MYLKEPSLTFADVLPPTEEAREELDKSPLPRFPCPIVGVTNMFLIWKNNIWMTK